MFLPTELATSLVVTRYGVGTYVNGAWVEGAAASLTIRAFVEPAPAEKMRALPEGRRTSTGILLITTTELRTANEAARMNADRITYSGATWEVETVDSLGHFLLAESHYEILALRVAI